MSIINIDEYSLDELKKQYPNLYITIKEKLPSLNNNQIAKVMNIAVGICGSCRDEANSCQCWNDE
jgi:hypothetical protein